MYIQTTQKVKGTNSLASLTLLDKSSLTLLDKYL